MAPGAETLLTFAAASALLALVPGPDNLFVLAQSALQGRAAGLLVTLGLCSGLLVHTLAVAAGVAVIFQTSLLAFTVLKGVGALYLLYLAVLAWRTATTPLPMGGNCRIDAAALYRRGVVMNVTNPKVSLFFLAFLPQFTDPSQGSVPQQVALLGGVFILITILVFGGIALLAGELGVWLRRSTQWQRRLQQLSAFLFVALALSLLLASR
jgi:threonine/homoserine/homoserine lactone efflux protein